MTRAKKSLVGLTEKFNEINVHKNYINGTETEEFYSGIFDFTRRWVS